MKTRDDGQWAIAPYQWPRLRANGHVTEFVYDELGRVAQTPLADGTSMQTVYDRRNEEVKRAAVQKLEF